MIHSLLLEQADYRHVIRIVSEGKPDVLLRTFRVTHWP
jgi:hypothetical protein